MVYRARGDVSYSELGGLSDQIRDLRECIQLPLTNPEIFQRVGVKPPKVGFDSCFCFGFRFPRKKVSLCFA